METKCTTYSSGTAEDRETTCFFWSTEHAVPENGGQKTNERKMRDLKMQDHFHR